MFKGLELDVAKQKIFQADEREKKDLGLVHIPIAAVTVQQMYVLSYNI